MKLSSSDVRKKDVNKLIDIVFLILEKINLLMINFILKAKQKA